MLVIFITSIKLSLSYTISQIQKTSKIAFEKYWI